MQALLDQQQHDSKAPGAMDSEDSSEVGRFACAFLSSTYEVAMQGKSYLARSSTESWTMQTQYCFSAHESAPCRNCSKSETSTLGTARPHAIFDCEVK